MGNPPLVLLTVQSHCPLQPLTIQPTPPRDVSRDKSICRHHCSKGVLGHAPSENVDILYRRSCILEHFRAYFEGFLNIFCSVCQDENIFFFKCKLSTQKIQR